MCSPHIRSRDPLVFVVPFLPAQRELHVRVNPVEQCPEAVTTIDGRKAVLRRCRLHLQERRILRNKAQSVEIWGDDVENEALLHEVVSLSRK